MCGEIRERGDEDVRDNERERRGNRAHTYV